MKNTQFDYDQTLKKYPHVIRAMKAAAILCTAEAVFCIRDLKRGDDYSGEAVNHFGGTREVLRVAWNIRHSSIVSNCPL